MKKCFVCMFCLNMVLVLVFLMISGCAFVPNSEDFYSYTLTPQICKILTGMDPDSFCETKGVGTSWENYYTSAMVDEKGCLYLCLTAEQKQNWINAEPRLQILQKVVGEERTVVTRDVPPTDDYTLLFYENAETCGIEVSEDYTKVVVGPGDDGSYVLMLPWACAVMQFFGGKPSEEICVEYIEMNPDGKVVFQMNYPQKISNSSNIDFD